MSSQSKSTLPLAVGALGVVFGDIGTSPLYAFVETLKVTSADGVDRAAVLGVLSAIFWSLLVVVTLKYVVLVMRADNQGEGGILSLLALVQRRVALDDGGWSKTLILLGVFGTALFYCDALLTPAISVLSAVEGLELLDPGLERDVVPITVGILVVLFAVQRRGTEKIGRLFGPIMIVWFAVLAASGLAAILRNPGVMVALNPVYAAALLVEHPAIALTILGAVFLVLTGGEALYADMGHFGKVPVRIAWFAVAWPALLLNYFGQGALVLERGGLVDQPLYELVPKQWLPAMCVLATAATIIASQAVITGAFSVTRQAIQLDLLPRLRILQTSASELGQIFVPAVNAFMLVCVLGFVVAFGSSSALANAYGAAVVGTMVITTVLAAFVAVTEWKWSIAIAALVFVPLLLLDLVFLAGNMTKLASGGWVPVALAIGIFGIFTTWLNGRRHLRTSLVRHAVRDHELPRLVDEVTRVEGTGVFLTSSPGYVPTALLRNLEGNKVAHKQVLVVSFEIARTPRQDPATRVRIESLREDIHLVRAIFGFMETPDLGEALRCCRRRGLHVFIEDCTFFLGWHLVRAREREGLEGLRRRLFAWMQRRSTQAAEFFRMPARGVVILATDVEI